MKVKFYKIQDREAGNVIVEDCTLAEAKELKSNFELMDKSEGCYVPDFYQIVEMED